MMLLVRLLDNFCSGRIQGQWERLGEHEMPADEMGRDCVSRSSGLRDLEANNCDWSFVWPRADEVAIYKLFLERGVGCSFSRRCPRIGKQCFRMGARRLFPAQFVTGTKVTWHSWFCGATSTPVGCGFRKTFSALAQLFSIVDSHLLQLAVNVSRLPTMAIQVADSRLTLDRISRPFYRRFCPPRQVSASSKVDEKEDFYMSKKLSS